MGKIITDKTFGEIENLYLEALDNKMSFEEIKLRIGEYEDDIPAFIKYLYAKYHPFTFCIERHTPNIEFF